jgi:hypothetical protein
MRYGTDIFRALGSGLLGEQARNPEYCGERLSNPSSGGTGILRCIESHVVSSIDAMQIRELKGVGGDSRV